MSSTDAQKVLTRITLVGSGLLTVALFTSYGLFHSQLAFANGADSFLDVFTAAILGWTVSVAARPQDADHPFGHTRAEPIGALVAAVVTGVLAFQVIQSAVGALMSHRRPELSWMLVEFFAVKAVFKSCIALVSRRMWRRTHSPAMRALVVDARNDVLVSGVAIVGFFAARYEWSQLDAWLALPIAVWIGYSGFDLALDNIRLLMGEAPSEQRQEELLEIVRRVPGVIGAHDLRAHYLGTVLYLNVHVVVGPGHSVEEGHDVGEEVRERLEQEDDVGYCSVHIDAV